MCPCPRCLTVAAERCLEVTVAPQRSRCVCALPTKACCNPVCGAAFHECMQFEQVKTSWTTADDAVLHEAWLLAKAERAATPAEVRSGKSACCRLANFRVLYVSGTITAGAGGICHKVALARSICAGTFWRSVSYGEPWFRRCMCGRSRRIYRFGASSISTVWSRLYISACLGCVREGHWTCLLYSPWLVLRLNSCVRSPSVFVSFQIYSS